MAYKFQLGAAKLSGSIQLTDGSLDSTDVNAATADNVVTALDNGDIPIAKLAAKTISGIDLGEDLEALTAGNGIATFSYDGSTAAVAVSLQRSGSAHALKLDGDGIAVLLSGSTGLAIDGGGLKLNAVPNTSLSASAVSFGTVSVSLGGSDDTPAFDLSDATDYPTSALVGTITNNQLSGAIANGKLTNSSVTVSGKTVALGASVDLSALTHGNGISTLSYNGSVAKTIQLQLSASNNALQVDANGLDLKATITGARTFSDDLTMGASASVAGDLTVSGDLTILGGVVSASVETLKIQDAQITVADGVASLADANLADAGFEVGNALASFTVQSGSEIGFNFSSSLPLQAGTLSGDSAFIDAWEISSTHISGNLPVTASAFYGDGSNLSGVSADNASELDFNIAVLNNTGNVVNRFTKVDSTPNNAFTVTMPLIDVDNDGAMFVIKDFTGNCASDAVTIAPSGSQRIEGAAQNIILESGFAAVTMVASHNGGTNPSWLII